MLKICSQIGHLVARQNVISQALKISTGNVVQMYPGAKMDKTDEGEQTENEIGENICERLNAIFNRDRELKCKRISKRWMKKNTKAEKEENVKRENDFVCDTSVDCLPRIVIDGWEVKYPCGEEVAKKLISYASPAPIGRGTKTVMDTDVRNSWQIDASKIKFLGEDWVKLFSDSKHSTLLETIRKVLAPNCSKISARFYKLLIYEKGSFFKIHRDTQRKVNHFATINVHLPCTYSGGRFWVALGSDVRTFKVSLNSSVEPLRAHIVAFFADCLHGVWPVTDGYRVNLTYEVFFEGGTQPEPPDHSREIKLEISEALSKLVNLGKWKGRKTGILLQHRYALASLEWDFLKGIDRITYDAIKASDRFDIELVPVTVSLNGIGYGDNEGASGAEIEYFNDGYPVDFTICIYQTAGKMRPWGWLRSKADRYGSEDSDSEENEDEEEEEEEEIDEKKYKYHNVLLSSFTVGDAHHGEDVETVDGPVVFVNDMTTRGMMGSLLHRDYRGTGNEGTSFKLTYTAAALLIKPKEQQQNEQSTNKE